MWVLIYDSGYMNFHNNKKQKQKERRKEILEIEGKYDMH